MKNYLLASAVAVALILPSAAMACSGCSCELNTDEGGGSAGWSVDERLDYINQNHLWSGGGKASADLKDTSGNGDNHEVQRNTTTLFYTTTLDYQSQDRWGVSIAVPFQYRTHSTFNSNPQDGTPTKSEWNKLSDIRVLGRYALTEDKGLTLLAGMKAPTGVTMESFRSGPQNSTQVDRGLQPGSGTWDLLLGLSQKGSITEQLGWFAQEMWQKPLEKNNGFAEGQKLNVSVGLRYAIDEMFTPQFQINGQNRWKDHGYNADVANSGGEVIYASPGLFVNFSDGTSVYGFVQVPVYQRVGGLSLVQDYSASIGLKHKF